MVPKAVNTTYDLGVRLGEEREDGGTRVAADNGDVVLGGVEGLANDRRDEGGGTDDVKGGDTEEAERQSQPRSLRKSEGVSEAHKPCAFRCHHPMVEFQRPDSPLGVVSTRLLEDLGKDGDGRVDGVRDDEDEGLGGGVGDGLGKGSADAGVDL